MKTNNRKKQEDFILLVAGVLCLVIFVITGFLLLNYWFESLQQEKLREQLAELKHGTTTSAMYVEAELIETPLKQVEENATVVVGNQTETAEESEISDKEENQQESEQTSPTSLSEINPDYVMWLQLADTEIDYPVVQRDNEYYLKHDFYGEKSKHGTIFLDESCAVEGKVLLLHGHHMKDGSMFGSLKNFKKKDYREAHRTLYLDFENKQETYEVFAGALIDLMQGERFFYEELPEGKTETEEYLTQLKNVAFWYQEPEWAEDERLVILSTCDYGTKEQRLIVVAIEKR